VGGQIILATRPAVANGGWRVGQASSPCDGHRPCEPKLTEPQKDSPQLYDTLCARIMTEPNAWQHGREPNARLFSFASPCRGTGLPPPPLSPNEALETPSTATSIPLATAAGHPRPLTRCPPASTFCAQPTPPADPRIPAVGAGAIWRHRAGPPPHLCCVDAARRPHPPSHCLLAVARPFAPQS